MANVKVTPRVLTSGEKALLFLALGDVLVLPGCVCDKCARNADARALIREL